MTLSSDGDISRNVSSGSQLLPMVGLYNRGDSMIDWMKFPGNNESGLVNSVIIAKDGGYLTAGWTNRADGTGKSNISVLRLSAPEQILSVSPQSGKLIGTTGTPAPESVLKSVTKMNPDNNITQENTSSDRVPSRTPITSLYVLTPIGALCIFLAHMMIKFRKN